jgi:hypothetical protein
MEEAGDQFGSILEINPMTEATAKDVIEGDKASGLSHGPLVDMPAGSSSGSLFWKQKQLEIIRLITSQEDASNQLSTGMSVFVEKTSVMKMVCIPCSPRAPWRVLIENPSGCS